MLPLVNNLDGEAKRNEMQNYLACMKHEQVMHARSSRYIPHIRMGKGDNCNYASGFKHGPPNQPNNVSDTNLQHLS